MISHHAALITCMMLISAADREMTDAELRTIGEIVRFLPVFADYDPQLLPNTAAAAAEMVDGEEGLDKTMALLKASLPPRLRDTAYALACDVAVSNRSMSQEVLRMLEILRHELEVDRLTAAAIERGARARFTTL